MLEKIPSLKRETWGTRVLAGFSVRAGRATLALAGFALGTLNAQEVPSAHNAAASSASQAAENARVQYLFPEQVTIGAGKPTVVEMHFRIAAGYHINSHKPYGKTLIPTNLVVVEGPDVTIAAVDFPVGKDFSFAFSPGEKLSIYNDEFVLRAHLTSRAGEHLVQAALRYQACDSNSCYPPRTIPVALDVIAK